MTLSLPWHSNSAWQPTEVTQFINHMNSGAGTLIVRTDAGLAYLKALGNPDGPHALVKDLLGTHLATMLGLPTFDYAVIEVTDLDELPFFKAGKAEPGPAFVTRGEDGSVWDGSKRLLEKIDNPNAISGLVVVDTWLRNTDRYYLAKTRVNWDNVFFSKESNEDGKLSLRVMDFSHAIQFGGELTTSVGSIANIKDEAIFGLFPEFRKRCPKTQSGTTLAFSEACRGHRLRMLWDLSRVSSIWIHPFGRPLLAICSSERALWPKRLNPDCLIRPNLL